jgi:hypothetical protein
MQVIPSNEKLVAGIAGIDSSGTTIVGWGDDTAGYVWDGAGFHMLPTGGGDSYYPSGISSDGSTIVGIENFPSSNSAVYWSAGTLVRLGFPGRAYAASAQGEVIVGERYPDGGFRWTAGSGMASLGDSCIAGSISSDGSRIVGTSSSVNQGRPALIWDQGSTIARNLTDVCQYDYGIDLGGKILENAFISSDGNVIAGNARDPAGPYPWAATLGYRIVLKPTISVMNPVADSLWLAGTKDTIRWRCPTRVTSVDIYLSSDDGATRTLIAQNVPGTPGAYGWKMDSTIMSAMCRIIIRESGGMLEGQSGRFRVKGTYLTRYGTDGQYERFGRILHAYNFGNEDDPIWPERWWSRYLYQGGIDEVTGLAYPATLPFTSAADSIFPSWPLWVKVFGEDQCYHNTATEVLSDYATDRWKEWRDTWGGSCNGFALSTLMAFDNHTRFSASFPEMPPFTSLIHLTCDDNVRSVINQLMVTQYGQPHVLYRGIHRRFDRPTETVQELRRMFLSETRDDRILTIGGDDGAHCIVPYGLERDPGRPEGCWINVYDNDYPQDTQARIWVDTSANGNLGSWTYSNQPEWGSTWSLWLKEPVSQWYATPDLPLPLNKAAGQHIARASLLGSAHYYEAFGPKTSWIIIKDQLGRRVGYADDSLLVEIPDAYPEIPERKGRKVPTAYLLPSGSYSVALNHSSDTVASFVLFGDSTELSYRRGGATPTETDLLYVGTGGGMTLANPDPEGKTVQLKMVLEEPFAEKVYEIGGFQIPPGDSVAVAPVSHDCLSIIHGGLTATSFDLQIRHLSRNGQVIFSHAGITLAGNAKYLILPDWNQFATDTLVRVLIDHGNKGSYDDSVRYGNQGVNDTKPAPGNKLKLTNLLWATNGAVNAIATFGNTIYIGGSFSVVGPPTGHAAAIDSATGLPDASFPQIIGSVYAIVPDGTGGWYIGGKFSVQGKSTYQNLVHINQGGTLDLAWNPNPNDAVYAVALSMGTVYAGGDFTKVGALSRNRIAAIDRSAGIARSWDANANSRVASLILSGSVIYAGGYFTTIGTQQRNRVAALDTATGLATTWDPNANNGVCALAISDSTVYAGGYFSTIGGQTRSYIAAIDVASGLATDWNPHSNKEVLSLAVSGTTVYAGGRFTSIGGPTRNRIAALSPSGGSATSWNPNANNDVTTIAVSGNTVYAGGSFSAIGGQTRKYLAALDASTGGAMPWAPALDNQVSVIAVAPAGDGSGTTIFAGGDFTLAGVSRTYIAALDATTGQATGWDPQANSVVFSIAVSPVGTVYAGGGFSLIGGQSRMRIAALDGVTGKATAWNPGASNAVRAIALSGTNVYAAGEFPMIAGAQRQYIAAIDQATGLATDWDPNPDGPVYALTTSGSTIFAGGMFTAIGGTGRARLASFDIATGNLTSWDPSANKTVYALCASAQTVYAGGDFDSVGGAPRKRLAAFDTESGHLRRWTANADAQVLAIAVAPSTVYAGGYYLAINGMSRRGMAAVDALSGQVTNWDPSPSPSTLWVYALAIKDSMVLIGGSFTTIGSAYSPNLACFVDAGLVTGVQDPDISRPGVPARCALEQNYPNPFNPVTTIPYQLAERALVTLKVYNLLGQEVATLVDGAVDPGYYRIRFDAGKLASGVYFCRLRAGDFVQTKKLLLLH